MVGKGENAGSENFLLFPTMFAKSFFLGVVAAFNPLPDNKMLDWSKLKQTTDDILNWILNEK